MTQWLRALTASPEDRSSFPNTNSRQLTAVRPAPRDLKPFSGAVRLVFHCNIEYPAYKQSDPQMISDCTKGDRQAQEKAHMEKLEQRNHQNRCRQAER